jgi:hypothetical protein
MAFELYYQFNSKKSEELYALRETVRADSLKIKIPKKYYYLIMEHMAQLR